MRTTHPCRGLKPYICTLRHSTQVAGLIEELVFRWLLQQKILPWIAGTLPLPIGNILKKEGPRIVLTALLFAGSHPYDDRQIARIFADALMYGMAAERGELIPAIVCHGLGNAVRSIEIFFEISGLQSLTMEEIATAISSNS